MQTWVPVVAALNGIAVGGACEMTLCFDARLGTPAAGYFLPENNIGLTISNASSLLLPRLAGPRALRLVLESARIGARDALAMGLLDEIVDPDARSRRPSASCTGGPSLARAGDAGRHAARARWLERFAVEVPDLDATVAELRRDGVRFRNNVVTGVGGRQIIAEDPSGNPVELFEPTVPEARLSPA